MWAGIKSVVPNFDVVFPWNPKLSSCITLPVSFHTEWRGSGPLQCRRVALFLHRNCLPDAEREAVIRGGVQPGEGCQALDSPQPWILPAAAELHTLRLLFFFLTSSQSPMVPPVLPQLREETAGSTAVVTGLALKALAVLIATAACWC